MSQNEANILNDLATKVKSGFFTYIHSNNTTNKIISDVIFNIYNKVQINYSQNTAKYLILKFFEFFCKENNNCINFNFNDFEDKKTIEDLLDIISIRLLNKDYSFPSKEDYTTLIWYEKHIKTNPTNMKKQTMNSLLKNNIFNLSTVHNNIYKKIRLQGVYICKDINNFYLHYILMPFEAMQRTNKSQLADYLSELLEEKINIYESTADIKDPNSDYLLISLFPIIKEEIFNPLIDKEFIPVNCKLSNNVKYKNTFQYTSFLKLRNKRPFNIFVDITKFIIVDFIRYLSQNEEQFNYIMNWLAVFFQTLNKSSMALVLIGDKETTDIFIKNIIEPIFAYKKEYITILNAYTLKESDEFLVKNKIFYHIDVDELTNSNIQDKRVSKLIRQMLKSNDNIMETPESRNTYSGETIITSSSKSPFPFLEDSFSRCSVFRVKNIKTILKQFKMDYWELEQSIKKELFNFSNILAQYQTNQQDCNIAITDEKNILNKMKKGILLTPNLEEKIHYFINAIKNKNTSYFKPLEQEENENLYKELVENFDNDNAIYQPLLSTYFNTIYEDIIFPDNADFIDILKERECLFNQTPDDKFKANNKKRYKIFDYKLAKNYRGNCQNTI